MTNPTPINIITGKDVDEFNAKTFGDNALDAYQRIATKTAIYPGKGTFVGLMYISLKGCGEAGEFAEHVGKAIRDDGFGMEHENLTADRHLSLMKEIGDDLWYLAAKCNELGIKLSECALLNIEKLADRSARGKLQGSGDNR